MSADFLLELLSEEIPARMQAKARNDLARMMAEALALAGLGHDGITTYSTPRRLALVARGLPAATEAVSEELKGPKTSAPQQALDGFLRKTGRSQDQLQDRDGIWFAVIDRPGRATADVLAEAVAAIVRDFQWPKSMRWGAESSSTASLRWVRPLHSIVALLGEAIVPVDIEGVACGAATLGHRFHHPGPITIGGAHDYIEKLRACHVLVDQAEREKIIRDGAIAAAEKAGLVLVEDEGLVVENGGLTEWPVPLLGSFDPDYLDVPQEVIQLTARTNQKYFVMRDGGGALAPHFVCVANIDANDGGEAIIAGNERVLAARLSDARFFWQQDLKVPLEEQAKKLEQIVFHEKLGTVADKVERVAKLARWLVEEGIVSSSPLVGEWTGADVPRTSAAMSGGHGGPVHGGGRDPLGSPTKSPSAADAAGPPPRSSPTGGEEVATLADQTERAARLAKADLVTGMVGEFPELQGVIGGHLARAQGEDAAVADAIRDHYKPVGQGDDVPTAPLTVAVSLADKLDTFTSFFAIDQRPTGSKDPFALRRSAIAIIRLMVANDIRWSLGDLIREARALLIRSWGNAGQIVSFEDEVSYRAPIPVAPANEQKAVIGHVFVVPHELEPEAFEIVGSTSYSAYSRDYLENQGQQLIEIGSLIDVVGNSVQFLGDRIAEAQKSDGIRVDLIRAILPREHLILDTHAAFTGQASRRRGLGVIKARKRNSSSTDDPIDILTRVKALQSFVETGEGANLLAGYKRAANILKKEGWSSAPAEAGALAGEGRNSLTLRPSPEHSEAAETSLVDALDVAGLTATAAIEAEDFTAAMSALASLRAPIDDFFEKVIVNDPDSGVRARRLSLLARFRDAVHAVADFSKIEG